MQQLPEEKRNTALEYFGEHSDHLVDLTEASKAAVASRAKRVVRAVLEYSDPESSSSWVVGESGTGGPSSATGGAVSGASEGGQGGLLDMGADDERGGSEGAKAASGGDDLFAGLNVQGSDGSVKTATSVPKKSGGGGMDSGAGSVSFIHCGHRLTRARL